MIPNILIIDDDQLICRLLTRIAANMGLKSSCAHSLKEGLAQFSREDYSLILLDLDLPDGEGLSILSKLINAPGKPEVIIITASDDINGAKIAFKYGAWDFIQKPMDQDAVMLPIRRALQYHEKKESQHASVKLNRCGIIGKSDPILRSLDDIKNASVTDSSVLITGETGTGKELFAKAIHKNSRRKTGEFIIVDCTTLPETLVESVLFGHEKGAFTGADNKKLGLISQANQGTLFLDEIGDLPLTMQKAFLRVLQEKKIRPVGGKTEIPIDFRLVSATNRDLEDMVVLKKFRKDLLFRIKPICITLPPLRDRKRDIREIIIEKNIRLAQLTNTRPKDISEEFLNSLQAYDWPGNVRELINTLEFALASAGHDPVLLPMHLPPEIRASSLKLKSVQEAEYSDSSQKKVRDGILPTLKEFRISQEKQYLDRLLELAKGDRRTALKISGISQAHLYGLLKKHHISSVLKK